MLKIVLSNARKYKSSMITLFVLILLAAMLLTVGFTMAFERETFYYDKLEELNSPHLSYYVNSLETDSAVEKISALNGIKEFEVTETISCSAQMKRQDAESVSSNFYIQDARINQKIAPLRLIDESKKITNNGIALPLVFRDTYGYKTDETIKFVLNNSVNEYTVCGFFEDIFYGSPMMGYYKLYLYGNSYDKLIEDIPESGRHGKLVNIQMHEKSMVESMVEQVTEVLDEFVMLSVTLGLDMNFVKTACLTPINIFAMILIGFSFIVVIVAIIVVSFSINMSVEDSIQSIGVLKSLGYKSSQVVYSMALQYGLLAILGGVLGVAVALVILPVIGNLSASMIGALWNLTPNILAIICSICIIIGLVILVSVYSAGKTKKITPIKALRNGIETHNFKKNRFPLSELRGNVNVGIAFKTIFSNMKQNIVMFIIVVSVTFAAAFSFNLYDNFVLNDSAVTTMMGMPTSNILLTSAENEQVNKELFEEIAAMKDVKRVTLLEQHLIKFAGMDIVGLYVSDDFANVSKKTIYEGRMPIHENEIAISNIISDRIGKVVGDVMQFTIRGKTEEFLITGLTEQMSQMGCVIDITQSGYQRLDPNYKVRGITIDLNDGVDTKSFIELIENEYKDISKSIVNIELALNNSISSMANGITSVMIGVIIVMSIVVALILFMLIKMKILRDKTDIGIYKSIGYTSRQLIFQIAGGFTSVIGIGAVIGGIIGALYTNSVVNLMLGSIGIKNANFQINYIFVVCLVIFISILAFIISCIVSLRIKHITPYNLLVE